MAIAALSESQITAELAQASLWKREGSEIVRKFAFSGFGEAMGFVNRVAAHAEKVDHHPDILVQYNKVTLRLSTHDANGLSERDFAFAKVADELCSKC
jgi:4a-hydroxytetrahydrobiopterin dehydratase